MKTPDFGPTFGSDPSGTPQEPSSEFTVPDFNMLMADANRGISEADQIALQAIADSVELRRLYRLSCGE